MKLYKNTLVVSCVCFAVLFPLSILFQSASSTNDWFALASNFAVGISCSIFVVLITTFLQYKTEQTRAMQSLFNQIYRLKYHYEICKSFVSSYQNSRDNINHDLIANKLDEIKNTTLDISKSCCEVVFFSKKEQDKLLKLFKDAKNLRYAIAKYAYLLPLDSAEQILSCDEFSELAKTSLSFSFKTRTKDDIEEWIKELSKYKSD